MPDRDDMAPGEIARSLKAIQQQLTHVIGRREYDAHREGIDKRLVAMEEDVKEIKDAVGRINERDDDRRRWMITAFVSPVITGILVVAILNALRL